MCRECSLRDQGSIKIGRKMIAGQKLYYWENLHGLLSWLPWLPTLYVYNVSRTTVEALEKTVSEQMSSKLARCPTNALQLLDCTVFHPNFSYRYLLVKELKVAKTRLVLALKTFRRREDLKTWIKIKTRREWSTSIAVQQAKTRRKQVDIEVTVAEGRQGLRSNYRESWMKSNTTNICQVEKARPKEMGRQCA